MNGELTPHTVDLTQYASVHGAPWAYTVVCLCVRRSVGQMCIFMTSELEVLKIGPHAKSDILVRLKY